MMSVVDQGWTVLVATKGGSVKDYEVEHTLFLFFLYNVSQT